jgi:NAD kinase
MRVLPDCAHLEGCDLIIVLGGDGTFLRAFEAAMPGISPCWASTWAAWAF